VRARRILLAFAILLFGAGGALVGRRGYLEAKALLAQRLIERAFAAHLRDGRPHRPWSWADTYPIAVLEIGRMSVRRSVLEGASGASLAFGVGHIDGTARPNAPGNCVLAGHRDRAFAFLEEIGPGDIVRLRTADAVRDYVVDGIGVVERTDTGPLEATGGRRLTLLTCYPFGGLLRSRWRFVVTAGAAVPGGRETITLSSSDGGLRPDINLK
jgi:sortase A